MATTSTARVLRWKERQKRDECVLTVTVNRTVLAQTLIDMKIPVAGDDSATLARGVQTLLERLQAKL
jgi:hypothetical protein